MGTVSLSLPTDGQTIDAADVNTPLNTLAAEFNGNIDNDNIKAGAAISGTKLGALTTPLSVLDANGRGGWVAGVLAAPNTVTANGNRSYDLVFNSTDYTDELSAGMRLKLTRTVTAPTQCTDLESGSSQYFSKTSPSGLSFTTTQTCMAWVKVESYGTAMGIIARRNADTEGWSMSIESDGRVSLAGLRIAGNNAAITSYQSVPLNRWVHVAASMDWSGSTGTIYIDGVAVPNAYAVTGTVTAIVQGTTALVVGAQKSAGTNPFDGKIAQAAVFSAVLSAATIRSYMSQTLSGSETSLVSAYSFNATANDLNANANNLSASGSATATNADTPFTQTQTGITAGTQNYAIITAASFSTNTTLTVQVPEGDTIPTSGGVSAVSYSTQKVPYGFPADSKFAISVYDSSLADKVADYCTDVPVDGIKYINVSTFYIYRHGRTTRVTGASAVSANPTTVTFPLTFGQTPIVTAGTFGAGSANVFTIVLSASTTQFTLRQVSDSGIATTTENTNWVAIG